MRKACEDHDLLGQGLLILLPGYSGQCAGMIWKEDSPSPAEDWDCFAESGMKKENVFKLRQSLILLLTALIWGMAFVAQSVGMEYVCPFTFIAIRFALGAAVLLPVILLQGHRQRTGETSDSGGMASPAQGRVRSGRKLWLGGVLCGVALMIASSLQQFGIMRTTVGKAGFITAMYIVIVPILGIVIGRRVRPLIWLCVLIAAAGLYLLSMSGRMTLQTGDALCLACAFVFALQIMLVDHYVTVVDSVCLSAVQFLTACVLGIVMMLLFEHPNWDGIWEARLLILYTGIMSSGVAYTLQVIGQRGLNPTVASLIMSLESVISAAAGFIFLHQTFTGRELAGCIMMAAAVILAQL